MLSFSIMLFIILSAKRIIFLYLLLKSLRYFIPYLIIMVLLAFAGSIAIVLGIIGSDCRGILFIVIYNDPLFFHPPDNDDGGTTYRQYNIKDTHSRSQEFLVEYRLGGCFHNSADSHISDLFRHYSAAIHRKLYQDNHESGRNIRTYQYDEESSFYNSVCSGRCTDISADTLIFLYTLFQWKSEGGYKSGSSCLLILKIHRVRVEDLYAKPYSDDHPENPENKV